jgi:hypothetical protein
MKHRIVLGWGLVMVLLAGCGGGGSSSQTGTTAAGPAGGLDTARVALAIQASIQSQRHLHASVKCPKSEPLRKNWHFVCFATTKSGQTPFVVTEVDDKGSTTYVGK